MIYAGLRNSVTKLEPVQNYHCPKCGNSPCFSSTIYSYIHIWFIPVLPTTSKRLVHCEHCSDLPRLSHSIGGFLLFSEFARHALVWLYDVPGWPLLLATWFRTCFHDHKNYLHLSERLSFSPFSSALVQTPRSRHFQGSCLSTGSFFSHPNLHRKSSWFSSHAFDT